MDRVACCFADELLAPVDIWDVLSGDVLAVEFRDSEERPGVEIHPVKPTGKGLRPPRQQHWPEDVLSDYYFLTQSSGAIPQPREE